NRSDLSARVAAVLKQEQARGPVGRLSVGTMAAAALIVLLTISPLRAIAGPQRGDDVSPGPVSLAVTDREPLRGPSRELLPAIVSDAGPLVRPANTQAAASQPLVFENVSITPNDGSGTHRGPVLSGETFSWINAQVLWLIQDAYGLAPFQILG